MRPIFIRLVALGLIAMALGWRAGGPRRPARGLWRRGKGLFIGGGAAGAVALLVVLTSFLSVPEPAIGGGLAPDILLATADGAFRLSDQRGKVSLLYFSFPG